MVRRRWAAPLAVLAAVGLLTGCLPERPSAGRNTQVRRVLVMGDSITHGLFGTSPSVLAPLRERLGRKWIAVTVDGYPAENPLDIWPDHPRWVDRMRSRVQTEDPDVIVIQSILVQEGAKPDRQVLYRAAVRELFDVAQSRGAHVYIVEHQVPPLVKERTEQLVAERIQAEEAKARGISAIPLDVWLDLCDAPYLRDGWHLNATGQRCHADAITAAVDQLRDSLAPG